MNTYHIMNRLKKTWIKIEFFIKNLLISVFQSLLFSPKKTDIKKILIFRIGSIGDNVCALPAISAIKNHFIHSEIHILTHCGDNDYGSMDKIINENLVRKVINYKGFSYLKLIKLLRQERYELFIELPKASLTFTQAIRNMLFAKFINVKYGFGWEIFTPTLFKKTYNNLLNIRERDRLLNILDKNKISINNAFYPLNIKEQDEQYAHQIITQHNLIDKAKNIAIVPKAKFPYKIWPSKYYKEVMDYLTAKGFNILIIGTEPFEPATKAANIYDFSGKLTLMQSAALFKHCSLVLTNDTGPMHLADALGVPIIALFSASNYKGLWYPSLPNTVLRNENVPCALCLKNTCKDNICMKSISVETVIDAINKKINFNNHC